MKTKTNVNDEGCMNPWAMWNCAKIPMELVADSTITAQAKIIYGVMALHARREGCCWMLQETLAEETGTDLRTVKRRVKELMDAGWLKSDRRGWGKSNRYHFLMPKSFERVEEVPDSESPDLRGHDCPVVGDKRDTVEVTPVRPSEVSPVTLHSSEDTKVNTRKEDTHGDVASVVDFWNSHPELPKVRSVGPKRRKVVLARLKDDFFMANWREAVAKVLASDFCMGKGDKGWQADFDWFTRPDTVTRLMEGRYDNRGKRRAGDAGTLKGGADYVKRLNIVGGGE